MNLALLLLCILGGVLGILAGVVLVAVIFAAREVGRTILNRWPR